MRTDTQNWNQVKDEIAELVHRIRRLCPDHRDPHRFHEEKSEIAYQLSQLSKRAIQ